LILLFSAAVGLGHSQRTTSRGRTWQAGVTRAGKHIPDYYPNDVGTVGGIVGVLGGLGGFVCPILFGYMLKGTGIWTTTWMFFLALTVLCLGWMHWTIRKMTLKHAPDIADQIEEPWNRGAE
jgi:NNP family nitrate/nitrite transporter-like MFS transporter